ncbi:MAG: hypothetical protein HY521_15055 [Proteobacteria bacterium]|nr:hypothetical protein [Pseudomonadota bacterium]
MATPSGADAHFDVALSNLAVAAFSDGSAEFVADQLFPAVPVAHQSDRYFVIEKGAFLSVPATLRAPKTRAARVEFEVSSDSYFAHNYALAAENALEDLANADIAIRLRENATRLVISGLRRDQEVRVSRLVTSAANVGSGVILAGTDKWGHPDSDPIAQVNTAHAFIRSRTGLRANAMLIDEDTLAVVRRHPLLLDMFKYTSGGALGDDELRRVFRVERILEGRGVVENAREGGASSITNIWGNNALIARIEPGVSAQTATLGLRYRWQPEIFPADLAVQRNVEARAGERKVEVVEAGYYQDERIVAPELGYLIAGTL